MQTVENTPPTKQQAYRARMRAKGLRPVQIWAYDTRSPEFQAEMRRQSLLVAQSESEKEILDWLEEISDWPE